MSRRTARPLHRRTILKGIGAAVALPWLEAMTARVLPATSSAYAGESGAPRRMAFLFTPNGIHMPDWTPRIEGTAFELPWILEPLALHKQELLVLSGLAQDQAQAHGDGPGDHARSAAVFLTGAHPVKTSGANLRVGVSVDQVAARAVGSATRFASLELGLEGGRQNGGCDSGYSCAYSNNISWRTPTTPSSKEVNPRLVFERLFLEGRPGETKQERAARRARRASVLDLVGEDARRLHKQLGGADRAKMDEYLAGLREIEQRIERSERERAEGKDPVAEFELPPGVPGDKRAHFQLMADLLVLAFQTDTTRIATFMLGNGGSNTSYREVGVPEGHHGLSHHGGDKAKTDKIRAINRFHVEQFAYLLGRLRSVPSGEGTLLDESMILFGSGIGDGNRHNHDELPVLLAGRGGGTIRPGRHVRYPRWTPLNNLFLSMLERVGAPATQLGDSRGPLSNL